MLVYCTSGFGTFDTNKIQLPMLDHVEAASHKTDSPSKPIAHITKRIAKQSTFLQTHYTVAMVVRSLSYTPASSTPSKPIVSTTCIMSCQIVPGRRCSAQ